MTHFAKKKFLFSTAQRVVEVMMKTKNEFYNPGKLEKNTFSHKSLGSLHLL